MKNYERPEVVVKENYCGDKVVESHPAYGVAVISLPQSSHAQSLFGSETKHSQTVCLAIYKAEVQRSLSTDWTHQKELICEIEMTHSQFARLITSPGNGSGVPVTLQSYRDGEKLFNAPGIIPNTTTTEVFKAEIKEAAEERVRELFDKVKELEEMIESGKTGKKNLTEVAKEMRRHCEQFAGSVSFVVDQANKTFEKIVDKSKVEIESFIDHKARQVGYDIIRQVGVTDHNHDKIENDKS